MEQKNIYLTDREITCIRNSWRGMQDIEKIASINFLMDFFEKCILSKDVSERISMYEFVTEGAVDALGNMGEHELAVEIDKKAIKASLECRRIWGIHYKVYDIWWNENERMKKYGVKLDRDETEKALKKCIILSHYVKCYFYEDFYNKKLEATD